MPFREKVWKFTFLWWPIFITLEPFDSYHSSNMIKIWFVMEGLLWSKVLDNENMFCESSSWENSHFVLQVRNCQRICHILLLKMMHLGIFCCVNYEHMILKWVPARFFSGLFVRLQMLKVNITKYFHCGEQNACIEYYLRFSFVRCLLDKKVAPY